MESGKLEVAKLPGSRAAENLEERRAGRQKIRPFNDSSLSKNTKAQQTDKNLSTVQPFNHSTDTVLSPYQPIALSSLNSYTSSLPYRHTSNNDQFVRQSAILPSGNRNYIIVSPETVQYFVNCRENALPYLSEILENSDNEAQITETLYILDRMLDNDVKGIDKMYPVLSRFNDTKSPNIQTFLAGIYRKTQVPDAFGPLVKMLIQNSIHPPKSNFDPNEEIGGAILSYLNPGFRR